MFFTRMVSNLLSSSSSKNNKSNEVAKAVEKDNAMDSNTNEAIVPGTSKKDLAKNSAKLAKAAKASKKESEKKKNSETQAAKSERNEKSGFMGLSRKKKSSKKRSIPLSLIAMDSITSVPTVEEPSTSFASTTAVSNSAWRTDTLYSDIVSGTNSSTARKRKEPDIAPTLPEIVEPLDILVNEPDHNLFPSLSETHKCSPAKTSNQSQQTDFPKSIVNNNDNDDINNNNNNDDGGNLDESIDNNISENLDFSEFEKPFKEMQEITFDTDESSVNESSEMSTCSEVETVRACGDFNDFHLDITPANEELINGSCSQTPSPPPPPPLSTYTDDIEENLIFEENIVDDDIDDNIEAETLAENDNDALINDVAENVEGDNDLDTISQDSLNLSLDNDDNEIGFNTTDSSNQSEDISNLEKRLDSDFEDDISNLQSVSPHPNHIQTIILTESDSNDNDEPMNEIYDIDEIYENAESEALDNMEKQLVPFYFDEDLALDVNEDFSYNDDSENDDNLNDLEQPTEIDLLSAEEHYEEDLLKECVLVALEDCLLDDTENDDVEVDTELLANQLDLPSTALLLNGVDLPTDFQSPEVPLLPSFSAIFGNGFPDVNLTNNLNQSYYLSDQVRLAFENCPDCSGDNENYESSKFLESDSDGIHRGMPLRSAMECFDNCVIFPSLPEVRWEEFTINADPILDFCQNIPKDPCTSALFSSLSMLQWAKSEISAAQKKINPVLNTHEPSPPPNTDLNSFLGQNNTALALNCTRLENSSLTSSLLSIPNYNFTPLNEFSDVPGSMFSDERYLFYDRLAWLSFKLAMGDKKW